MTPLTKSRSVIVFAVGIYAIILLRTAWITDDTLITLRTVRNFLAGHGPVWNIGERVQAYTHPLWMFMLTGVIGVTGEYYYTVLAVSIALSLSATLLIVLRHAPVWPASILALAMLGFSKAYVDYSTSGLENPLNHLLLVLFYLIYFADIKTARSLFWAALIASLGILNRMDTALIYLLPLLYGLWRVRSWRSVGVAVLGFLPLLAWEIFSVFFYGFPFPNTAYAKLNTGISSAEYAHQGLMYLLRSFTTDPVTGLVIVGALALAPFQRNWRAFWLVAGMALYLLYVIRIGGDYTTGRFLSVLVVCGVVYFMHHPIAKNGGYMTFVAIATVVLVGLMPYRESTLLIDGNMPIESVDNKGIADERKQYLSLRLSTSNRFNRFYENGVLQGWIDPAPFQAGAIGRIGFTASNYTHVVDVIGLADPLLARLPARYDPNWRAGHPIRVVPDGYLASTRTGKNQILDPDLSVYYDKLKLLITGDLFDPQRFMEIWRFNRGDYDHLINQDHYRFPEVISLEASQVRRIGAGMGMSVADEAPTPISFTRDGVFVHFDAVQHAPFLDLGLNLDRFALRYYEGEVLIHEQLVDTSPIRLDKEFFQIVQVPEQVASQGYTDIHLYPRIAEGYKHEVYPNELSHSDYRLGYFDLIDIDGQTTRPIPAQLAEAYYFTYYQGEGSTRTETLANLSAQMQQVDSQQWQQLPLNTFITLSRMPDPAISKLFQALVPAQSVFHDPNGKPKLSYLGASVAPTSHEAETQGLEFNMYFDVLDRLDTSYSVWFHIVSLDNGQEWMIYDYFPPEFTNKWVPGEVYQFPGVLEVAPGNYDIAFGFWTPERDRLYVDVANDIYWQNLGIFERPAPLQPGN